jgi:DnaJ-class molecular chaperone
METCKRCQGNGEIVTDWDSYLHPANLAAEENSVAECPDCDGEGAVSVHPLQDQGQP